MIDLGNARLLARYRQWADQLTFDAVAGLPPGEAAKERPTLFKTMIGTLNHNYLIDLVWQAHIEGRDHDFQARNVVLHDALPDLWRAQQAINQWYIDWSDRQSRHSLDEIVHFKFIGGEPGAMSRGDILLHVVNHATYHRGLGRRDVLPGASPQSGDGSAGPYQKVGPRPDAIVMGPGLADRPLGQPRE
jgi:uncharacterized damage-inducible protein DinB